MNKRGKKSQADALKLPALDDASLKSAVGGESSKVVVDPPPSPDVIKEKLGADGY
jgi:hypothetical protein